MQSAALQSLIEQFAELPGIGKKTAERLAYYVLRAPTEEAMKLAHAIRDVKTNLRNCRICFNISESEVCAICDDSQRDAATICVVEQPNDLLAIENSGNYHGLYHVLMGAFAPVDGVGPDDLTIGHLLRRIRERQATDAPVEEIILATNPNFEGDGTAVFIRKELEGIPKLRISRLARGMPSGSNLEHVSRTIVADALEGRQMLD